MKDLVGALRQKQKRERNSIGDLWGDWVIGEAAERIITLENALTAFGEFLEPMRFDRKMDDERAIELDRLYRSLMSKD